MSVSSVNTSTQFHASHFFIEFCFYRPQTKFAKVMFLHVSVSHSVHRGGAGEVPPPPTATAAGGTHPTGMHSCWQCEHTIRVTMLSLFLKYWEDCCPQTIMNMSVGISLLKNKLHAATIHLSRLN